MGKVAKKILRKLKGKLVLLTWIDATSCSDWHETGEPSCLGVATHETVGWVQRVTDDLLEIHSSRSQDRKYRSQITTIPMGCVQHVRELK